MKFNFYYKKLFLFFMIAIFLLLNQPDLLNGTEEKPETAKAYQVNLKRNIPQFGSKTAHLMALQEFIEDSKINKNIDVSVPEFYGISHDDVIKFLENNKFDVKEKWQEILKEHFEEKSYIRVINDNSLSNKFWADVEVFSNKIAEFFKKNNYLESIEGGLLKKFVEENKDEAFIVRSTSCKEDVGAEDGSKKVQPGAGAFQSFPFIKPDGISEYIGRVIASYYKKEALAQLVANEQDEKKVKEIISTLSLPVLVQIMIKNPIIKEEDAKKRKPQKTLYGVMFTTENITGEYNSQKGTKGYTQIDCSTTHEAVTDPQKGGLINSFYVSPYSIYPIARDKNYNLTLQDVKNLYKIARAIEEFFSKKMDVEFAVLNNKIYLLQAREASFVQNNDLSYLDTGKYESLKKEGVIFEGYKVNTGKGVICRVKEGADKNGILIGLDFEGVIKEFFELSVENQHRVKCIVIGSANIPSSMSHPAITCRQHGISALHFDSKSYEKIKDLLEKNENIVLDTQRGTLIFPTSTEQMEDIFENTKTGWLESPFPTVLSASAKFIDKNKIQEITEKLFKEKKLFEYIESVRAAKKGSEILDPRILIQNILIEATGKNCTLASEATCSLVALLITRLFNLSQTKESVDKTEIMKKLISSIGMKDEKIPQTEKEIIAYESTLLSFYVMLVANEILQVLEKKGFDIRSILHPLHFIKTLLYQKDQRSIDQTISMKTIFEMKLQDKSAIEGKTKALSQKELVLSIFGSELALSDELKKNWNDFLKNINPTQQKILSNYLIKIIIPLDIQFFWLNAIFNNAYKINTQLPGSTIDKSHFRKEAELSGIPKTLSDIIKDINNHKILISQKEWLKDYEENGIQHYVDPGKFKTLWEEFEKHLKFFMSKDFLDILNEKDLQTLKENPYKANPSIFVALDLMEKFVNAFDSLIKLLIGSTLYKDIKEKVTNFYTMIKQYLKLFEAWALNTPKNSFKTGLGIPKPGEKRKEFFEKEDIKSYINLIAEKLENIKKSKDFLDTKQLRPSRGFNVNGILITSSITFNRYEEMFKYGVKSLETTFSILHQNLLNVISTDICYAIDMKKMIPQEIYDNLTIFSNKKFYIDFFGEETPREFNTVLTGIDVNNSSLKLTYNIPLQNHSTKIIQIYNYKSKEYLIECQFFGRSGNILMNHFARIAIDYILTINSLNGTIKKYKLENGFYATSSLGKNLNSERLIKLQQRCIEYTFGKKINIKEISNNNVLQPTSDILKILYLIINALTIADLEDIEDGIANELKNLLIDEIIPLMSINNKFLEKIIGFFYKYDENEKPINVFLAILDKALEYYSTIKEPNPKLLKIIEKLIEFIVKNKYESIFLEKPNVANIFKNIIAQPSLITKETETQNQRKVLLEFIKTILKKIEYMTLENKDERENIKNILLELIKFGDSELISEILYEKLELNVLLYEARITIEENHSNENRIKTFLIDQLEIFFFKILEFTIPKIHSEASNFVLDKFLNEISNSIKKLDTYYSFSICKTNKDIIPIEERNGKHLKKGTGFRGESKVSSYPVIGEELETLKKGIYNFLIKTIDLLLKTEGRDEKSLKFLSDLDLNFENKEETIIKEVTRIIQTKISTIKDKELKEKYEKLIKTA